MMDRLYILPVRKWGTIWTRVQSNPEDEARIEHHVSEVPAGRCGSSPRPNHVKWPKRIIWGELHLYPIIASDHLKRGPLVSTYPLGSFPMAAEKTRGEPCVAHQILTLTPISFQIIGPFHGPLAFLNSLMIMIYIIRSVIFSTKHFQHFKI